MKPAVLSRNEPSAFNLLIVSLFWDMRLIRCAFRSAFLEWEGIFDSTGVPSFSLKLRNSINEQFDCTCDKYCDYDSKVCLFCDDDGDFSLPFSIDSPRRVLLLKQLIPTRGRWRICANSVRALSSNGTNYFRTV